GKEQVLEQVLRGILRGRFAGAHHPVDFHQRFELIAGGINVQGIGNVRTLVEVVDVKNVDRLYIRFAQCLEHLGGNFRVGRRQQFTGFLVDDVVGDQFSFQVVIRNVQ